jgi:hypothetical protein
LKEGNIYYLYFFKYTPYGATVARCSPVEYRCSKNAILHRASWCSHVADSGTIEVYLLRHCFFMWKDGMSLWDKLNCFILKLKVFIFSFGCYILLRY